MLIQTIDFHFRKQNEGFQLDVHPRNSSQPLATANLNFPSSFLSGFESRQLDFDTRDPQARVERLREFGRKLYQQIFTLEVRRVWLEYKLKHEFLVLCIRIAPEANELEAIAWETLFDGEEFIAAGTKTTLSRLPLDIQPQAAPPAVPLPFKMLALVSSPLDLPDHSRLQMEREQEILLEAINDPAGQGRLRADFEDEAKLEILEGSLETPYQIFHFTGHGITPEDGGGLLLEDAQGKSHPTSVAEILAALERLQNSLRLVVLSGCQTARRINAGEFSDISRGLLRRNIPAVIAMQFSISDTGGLKFAQSFYYRIASGCTLEAASHAARRALLLSEDYFLQADALAPVLLVSNGDCLQTKQAEAAPTVESPKIDFSFHLPLPQLSSGFYGRRREYRQVRDAVLKRNQRAVIVHGIGGIGKTALVSHIATRLKKHFQGVYAFDCSSGTLTLETVLIKLHQYFETQGINAFQQLLYQNLPPDVLANYVAQILSQWSLLLIFDNCERRLERTDKGFQIADENLRTFITTLVKATATHSRFLFTSRYLFNLDDKRLGTIQSLPLEDLSRPEALSFMQKLQHLATASYGEKLEALKTFGGHPYALITLDHYCNHQALSMALEDAKNIHAELREFLSIELTYGQLSERGRDLLNRLAAFRQSVPYEAAEWVMGKKVSYATDFLQKGRDQMPKELKALNDEEIVQMLEENLPERRQAEDLTHQIEELVEWGLLTPIQENGQPKGLSVHSLVRDFCRDKQQSEIWRERLRDAAACFTNLIKLIEPEDKSQDAVWMEMEAFELLMEAEDFTDAARLLVSATPLLDRWGFGQYLESQHRRLFNKLNAGEAAGIFHNFGKLIGYRGRYDKALEYYDRSLKTKEDIVDRQGIASLAEKGNVYFSRGEYEMALETFSQVLRISEELEDRSSVAKSLHQIGMIHHTRHDYDTALDYYDRSLKIGEKLGERLSAAKTFHQIASIHYLRGDHNIALEFYERSLRIKEELDDRSGGAKSLQGIGMVHQSRGDYDKALAYYDRSLKISEELGDRSGYAKLFHLVGTIHYSRGDYVTSLEYGERSLKIRQEIGDRPGVAESSCQIGILYLKVGRYDEAFRNLFSALSIFKEIQSPYTEVASINLEELRAKWGEESFDAAWKEVTEKNLEEISNKLKDKSLGHGIKALFYNLFKS